MTGPATPFETTAEHVRNHEAAAARRHTNHAGNGARELAPSDCPEAAHDTDEPTGDLRVAASLGGGNPGAAELRPGGTARQTASPVRVAPMTDEHADAVLAIYQAGLDTGNASFETTAPTWASWDAGHLAAYRFVALDQHGTVIDWIAATPVSSRCVYAGVLEHSIYVRPDRHGHGVGRALLATYIAATEAAGIWTLQTGIFPENTASLALHGHAGFRTVGRRERIGKHHGQWRDVILIERRTTLDA